MILKISCKAFGEPPKVCYNLGAYDFDEQLLHWLSDVKPQARRHKCTSELVDLGYLLHELRLVKSAAEIKAIRKAADISVPAHRRAMIQCARHVRV